MIQKNTLLEVADNSGAREVLCIGSVSYTHLDVYKRQDIDYMKVD